MSEQIEGRNPILEALRSKHEITKIFMIKGEQNGPLREIAGIAHERGIPIVNVDHLALQRMTTTRNHQGVIAMAAEWKYAQVDEILAYATQRNEAPFILFLDGVEDPQNFGSIIRTAEAAGVHGIIISERRAVGLTGAVARASAGAIEHILVARVVNLTRTLEELKACGIWFTAAEMDEGTEFSKADLAGPIGLVMGGEGKGISRLVKEHCDQVVQLPMYGKINSLNVAVATGVFLYEIRRQRLG